MMNSRTFLQRVQNYSADKPLQSWFLTVGLLFVVTAVGLRLLPDARNLGLIGFLVPFVLGPPTAGLVRRLRNPAAPQQEQAIGIMSVFAALGSIASLCVAVFSKRAGLLFVPNIWIGLLLGYSVFLLLALAFGVAAQNTKAGRLGFRIAAGWFGLLIGVVFLSLIRGSLTS